MSELQSRVAVGIDVGGTFTDVVAYDPQAKNIVAFKVPSSSQVPAQGVIDGLHNVLSSGADISSIIHGTTVATNAILEQRGASTALITTRGFRDVLEIGRQVRENLYDIRDPGRPEAFVPRNLRLEITERVTHSGEVLQPLALEEVPNLIEVIRGNGVEVVAVCLLHSYAHPVHERALKAELQKTLPYVCISSDINGEFREYERTNTAVLNAYLMPLVSKYLDRLSRELAEVVAPERVHVVRSSGGMMSISAAKEVPLATVMSGPAGGVAACRYLARKLGISNAVAFDMGGTSTDVCLIADGEASVTNQRRIGGQPFRMPTVAVESIGAGGGSIAWIDPVGALKVGPQSAGADPGPACYGLGGTIPTVTDANLVLGYLDPNAVLGGRIRLDRARSEEALRQLADRYGYGLRQVAEGIVEVANSNMIRALRVVSVQKGFDLRDFTLIAFGGAGPMHAGRLAQKLNMSRVIVPAFSGAFSALGCLVSDLRYDAVRTRMARFHDLAPGQLETAFADMKAEQERRLKREGYAGEEIVWRRSLDVRYVGQKYELEVPLAPGTGEIDLGQVRGDFNRIHQRSYSYATDEEMECVNLRLVAVVPTSKPDLPLRQASHTGDALLGEIRAYFSETGEVTADLHARERLAPEQRIGGPAIIVDEWSTTVVCPGQTAVMDQYGNLILEVEA